MAQRQAVGRTVVIQNDNAAVVGAGGDGIGYAGLPNSLAVEFDTWKNADTVCYPG
jgi:lectin family protein